MTGLAERGRSWHNLRVGMDVDAFRIKGLPVTSDKRNTNVMIALLGSLTLGALLLLWLEPRPTGLAASRSASLMATVANRIEFATIEYVPAGQSDLESYDCVVQADGVRWNLRESTVNARIAVVGTGARVLSDEHRRQLLIAVRDLTRSTGLSPNQIRLAANLRGDPAAIGVPEAADLVEFLRAKSFVR